MLIRKKKDSSNRGFEIMQIYNWTYEPVDDIS